MATEISSTKNGTHTLGFSFTSLESKPFQIEISQDDSELRVSLYDHVEDLSLINVIVPDKDMCNHITTVTLPLHKRQELAKYFRQVADMLSSDSTNSNSSTTNSSTTNSSTTNSSTANSSTTNSSTANSSTTNSSTANSSTNSSTNVGANVGACSSSFDPELKLGVHMEPDSKYLRLMTAEDDISNRVVYFIPIKRHEFLVKMSRSGCDYLSRSDGKLRDSCRFRSIHLDASTDHYANRYMQNNDDQERNISSSEKKNVNVSAKTEEELLISLLAIKNELGVVQDSNTEIIEKGRKLIKPYQDLLEANNKKMGVLISKSEQIVAGICANGGHNFMIDTYDSDPLLVTANACCVDCGYQPFISYYNNKKPLSFTQKRGGVDVIFNETKQDLVDYKKEIGERTKMYQERIEAESAEQWKQLRSQLISWRRCAMDLAQKKGKQNVTMEDFLTAANISLKTFQEHYTDIQDLLW